MEEVPKTKVCCDCKEELPIKSFGVQMMKYTTKQGVTVEKPHILKRCYSCRKKINEKRKKLAPDIYTGY